MIRTIADLLESNRKSLLTHPNSKMIHRVLYYISTKKNFQVKPLCKMLGISFFEMLDIIDMLMQYGMLYNYYTKNKLDEKYSHYQLSKLGKLYVTSYRIIDKKTRKERENERKEKRLKEEKISEQVRRIRESP